MTAPAKEMARIRKLLSLAESPNENEAARAREEAERRMKRHGLTLADFEADVIEVADDRRDPQRAELARIIGIARSCAAIVSKRDQGLAFRGRAHAARAARELYQALLAEVTANCEIGPRDPGRHVWRLCYWLGFLEVLTERFAEEAVPKMRTGKTTAIEQRADDVPAAPAERQVKAMPAIITEAASAIGEFSAYFRPEDVRTAIQRLCDEARAGGRALGARVPIARPDAAGALPTSEPTP